jgi:hypothetical protein
VVRSVFFTAAYAERVERVGGQRDPSLTSGKSGVERGVAVTQPDNRRRQSDSAPRAGGWGWLDRASSATVLTDSQGTKIAG